MADFKATSAPLYFPKQTVVLKASSDSLTDAQNNLLFPCCRQGSATSDGANVVDGNGNLSAPMFFVEDAQSSLWLEGVSLTGGGGLCGGVVAAYQNASVTLVDCEVYGNAVSDVGGERG